MARSKAAVLGSETNAFDAANDGVWTHQQTFLWLADHPGYLTGYEGKWVAMVGPTIVAHDEDIREVSARAREAGFEDALFVPVLPAGEYVY